MTNDPYFDTDICIERLLREYHIHKKLIVAVDFDDTVYDFHNAGHKYPDIVYLLRRCQKLGFYIVLFTGCDESQFEVQVEYMGGLGVKIDAVNKNPIPLPFGNHGKIYYNILLDDRAGLYQAWRILDIVVGKIEDLG